MNEQQLRGLIEEVREGKVTRRDFITTLLAFGVAAPIAGQLLMHAGIAQAQAPSAYKGTKRGGGGALKVLWWQGATLLNPHFATGTKDQDGSEKTASLRLTRTASGEIALELEGAAGNVRAIEVELVVEGDGAFELSGAKAEKGLASPPSSSNNAPSDGYPL